MPSILISEEGFIALTLYCIQSRASRIFNRHFYRCHVKVWRSSRSFHRQPHILHGVATQSFQSPSPIMRQGSPRRVLSTGNMASIEYRRTGFRGKLADHFANITESDNCNHILSLRNISSTFPFVQPRAYMLMYSRFFLTIRCALVIKRRCVRSEWS